MRRIMRSTCIMYKELTEQRTICPAAGASKGHLNRNTNMRLIHARKKLGLNIV